MSLPQNDAAMDAAVDAAIDVMGVHKHFGAVHAVNGVDLRVLRGEVFGLIGHNGAGKSTLFKMMLGLISPTSGVVRVGGTPVQGPGFRALRRHIGYLPENVVLYDNLSGLETLEFFAKLKGVKTDACPRLLEQVGLSHAAGRHVREYSKGMRQRLGFAQALLGQPQVLFLDEPTTGLDPEAIRDFYATLRSLRAQGVTMILSSHILAELQERVDRLAVMAGGCVRAVGSVQALREEADLPLRIRIICGQGRREAVLAAVARSGLQSEPSAQAYADGEVLVSCHRGLKMNLLRSLGSLGSDVHDIVITEPSLEDMFFGLPQARRPS